MEHVMSPPQPYLPPKKNNIKTMVLPKIEFDLGSLVQCQYN